MKCHYEVMGVTFDVNNEELKKVYRKLALQHHPDKNPDNVQEATSKFREIQQAYDVLSDPQERAWYDKHRDAILRGKNSDYQDESLDLFQFFNSSCYTGYDDDDRGFYAVYREVFNKIAAEDAEFMDEKESDFEIPSFGRSDSSYEQVVHEFYAYWQSYFTSKTYVWINKYDITTAPNRKVVKLMEKDNKKLRDEERKKRNEEVRTLVGFVRKRDKRIQAHKKELEEKAARNALKAEENRRRRLEGREKQIEDYKESEWTSMAKLEKELKAIESNLAEQFREGGKESRSGSDDDEIESLYCVACNKYFRTEKAFENHEKSKKHKENAAFLKEVMKEEEERFSGNNGGTEDSDSVCGLNSNGPVDSIDDFDSSEDLMSDEEEVKVVRKQKTKKKKRNVITTSLDDVLAEPAATATIMTEAATATPEATATIMTEAEAATTTSEKEPTKEESKETEDVRPKISNGIKTSVKKAKKKVKTASNSTTSGINTDPSLNCSVCRTTFSSRNKLFGHLKKTGHAVAINTTTMATNDKGTTSTKGKKNRRI